MVHTRKKSKPKSPRFTYELDVYPNPYGFGRNYNLILKDGKTGKSKKFYLGQDAKVFSRMLGMRMGDAVGYYSKKANSKEFDKVKPFITKDILRAVSGKKVITQEVLGELMGVEEWGMAVE